VKEEEERQLRAFALERLQLIEVGIVVKDEELMVLRAGGDQEVGCGYRDALGACKPRQIASEGPDFGCCRNGLELLFDFPEQLLIPCIASSVPEFDAHHVADHRLIIGCSVADPSPNGGITLFPERLDPGRRVDEEALA
jgi:hypothetical protein